MGFGNPNIVGCDRPKPRFSRWDKRTAMAAAALYLEQNDIKVVFTNQEYEDSMLHVVNDKPSIEEIREWLQQHVVSRS